MRSTAAARHGTAASHTASWTVASGLVGAVFAALASNAHGASPAVTTLTAVFGSTLTALAAHDALTRIVPNRIVYPGAALALALSWMWADRGLLDATLGGAVAFATFCLVSALMRGGFGGGDLKMAGLVGLVVGYPHVSFAMTVTAVSGGIVAIVLLIGGHVPCGGRIPYGPFIALGGLAALLR